MVGLCNSQVWDNELGLAPRGVRNELKPPWFAIVESYIRYQAAIATSDFSGDFWSNFRACLDLMRRIHARFLLTMAKLA
jgi:hypothetical protein